MDTSCSSASAVGLMALLAQMKGLIAREDANIRQRLPLLLLHIQSMEETLSQFPAQTHLHVFDHASSELQVLIDILKSVMRSDSSWFEWPVVGGLRNDGSLREIDDRLRCLHINYISTALAYVMSSRNMPKEVNDMIPDAIPDLPSSPVGFDRIREPLEFLQENNTAAAAGLRIIAIHGEPGLGKTTLLNKLWDCVSSTMAFSAKVYVEVSDSKLVSSLQSEILQQLPGKSCRITFSSCEFGRRALEDRLVELKRRNKAVFLALDNVWSAEMLADLLPQRLDSLLPPSSCIAVTSRQSSVVQTLENLCSESKDYQILSNNPGYLSLADSEALFSVHADMRIEEHAELIHNIVPLCGGLPLALKVWGRLFRGKEKREERAWREVYAQTQVKESGFPQESKAVIKGLQLIYDELDPACQKAFVDVAGFFCGWRWSTVECIVGKEQMKTLEDCYLLTEAKGAFLCHRSGIDCFGRPKEPWQDCHQTDSLQQYGELLEGNVVTMHDLILKFGKWLLEKEVYHAKIDYDGENAEFIHQNVRDLLPRSRFLWKRSSQQEIILPNQINNLLFLHLESSLENPQRLILNVETKPTLSCQYSQNASQSLLRFQSLENITSSALCTMISPQLRELHFHKCSSLRYLPPSCTRLEMLERLRISDCSNFQSMPECCSNWKELRELFLKGCGRIIELPTTLGTLPNLKIIIIKECIGLTSFPKLSDLKQLSYLEINSCYKLNYVPTLPKSLKILILVAFKCNVLQGLTAPNFLPKNLEMLHATRCKALLELPEKTGSLMSLRELSLYHCSILHELPESICNATSLETLDLRECSALSKLPRNMGHLKSLKNLDLSHCSKLHELPESICNATSLQTLDVSGCSALTKLPQHMGNLKLLKNLDLLLFQAQEAT